MSSEWSKRGDTRLTVDVKLLAKTTTSYRGKGGLASIIPRNGIPALRFNVN